MHQSTKRYGHDLGLSVAFRQWRAKTHCRFIHGYALSFKFIFEAKELDERNWVIDFGSLDSLKDKLRYYFDHTIAVAKDDPQKAWFMSLENMDLGRIVLFDKIGVESFAEFAYFIAMDELRILGQDIRVRVVSCEVAEHGANSAIFIGPQP